MVANENGIVETNLKDFTTNRRMKKTQNMYQPDVKVNL